MRMVGTAPRGLPVSPNNPHWRIPGLVVEMKGGCWIPCSASTQCVLNGILRGGATIQDSRSQHSQQPVYCLPDYFRSREVLACPTVDWLLSMEHMLREHEVNDAFENIYTACLDEFLR